MQEGVQVQGNRVRTQLLTFEYHCLEMRLTFGGPFKDSGVVPTAGWHAADKHVPVEVLLWGDIGILNLTP